MWIAGFCIGAGEMNRTPDLLITNELLYRLSYTGLCYRKIIAVGSLGTVIRSDSVHLVLGAHEDADPLMQ